MWFWILDSIYDHIRMSYYFMGILVSILYYESWTFSGYFTFARCISPEHFVFIVPLLVINPGYTTSLFFLLVIIDNSGFFLQLSFRPNLKNRPHLERCNFLLECGCLRVHDSTTPHIAAQCYSEITSDDRRSIVYLL